MSKKKILIIAIILLIIAITILIIYLNNRIIDDNSGFTLKDNLQTEVYTKANIKDYIDKIDGKILKQDPINTKKLGTQEISFIYLNKNNQKRRGTIQIEIKDTEQPLVWINNNYSTKVGQEPNFDNIICVDNYDNKPKCEMSGNYDINTPGTYNLKYKAEDNSGNIFEKNITLTVYEPVTNTHSTPSNTKQPQTPTFTDFKQF